MTELELYKFVQGKELEWHGDALMLWLEGSEVQEFSELERDCIVEDGGYEVTLVHGGVICLELNDVCELHGIDPENILECPGTSRIEGAIQMEED